MFNAKLKRNVMRNKMCLVYWWTHWFWITAISISCVSSTPLPLSSYETISTSLKSALVQNENTFQSTNDQQKVAVGIKSVPLTFETSDTDDTFGGSSEIDSETIARNKEFLVVPPPTSETKASEVESISSLSLPNAANSTNNASSQASTTMLSSVTESVVIGRWNSIKLHNFHSIKIDWRLKSNFSVPRKPQQHKPRNLSKWTSHRQINIS